MNVELAELAAVVAGGDALDARHAASGVQAGLHCTRHRLESEPVNYDLVRRVHPGRQVAVHDTAEGRAISLVRARLQGRVLAADFAPGPDDAAGERQDDVGHGPGG